MLLFAFVFGMFLKVFLRNPDSQAEICTLTILLCLRDLILSLYLHLLSVCIS